MNFSQNQRRLYLLSGVLLALTIALCATWGLRRKTSAPAVTNAATPAPTVAVWETPSPNATEQPLQATSDAVVTEGVETARTVVYYQDNYGYLVPVTRTVPMEEGIARATLNLMVQGAYNDMEAARLGLRTVIPEGTDIELDINAEGVARINLGKNAMNCADAASEANMVSAVVQTLTEFPTVEKVTFLVGGMETEELTHGTSISGEFTRGTLNLESSASISPGEAKTVMLYFPGDASSVLVPVTRMVYVLSDLSTAVLELAKGPSAQSPKAQRQSNHPARKPAIRKESDQPIEKCDA
jgi:germination protein M